MSKKKEKEIEKEIAEIKYEMRPSFHCENKKDPTSYDVMEDNRQIARIGQITREDKTTYWYFADETKTNINSDYGKRITFPNKDIAYQFIVALRKHMKRHVEERPLPDDVMDFIERKARLLNDRKKALVSELYNIQSERWSLLSLARKYNVHEIEYALEDVDRNKVVKSVMEFKCGDHPFFSESTLYELIGKSDARTVLALMSKLIEFVAPDEAIMI